MIAAYANGFAADMLQAKINDEWGVIWTISPCCPNSMERAGRQFSRSRAASVLHIRRAVLHVQGREDQAVVVVTELPSRRQQVRDLNTAGEVILRGLLSDAALAALEVTFAPSAKEAVQNQT